MPSYHFSGTVTIITNKPEAPRGASVRAGEWGTGAAKATRAALKRRKIETGKNGRGITRVVVALTRHAIEKETQP